MWATWFFNYLWYLLMWLNSKNVNFVINFQHIVWKQWIVSVINHPSTFVINHPITEVPGFVFPVGFGKIIFDCCFLSLQVSIMVPIQESTEIAVIKSSDIFFFLLSSILALNHVFFCYFFHKFSWVSSDFLFSIDVWPWCMALGLSFTIWSRNEFSPSFCHPYYIKYAITHLVSHAFWLKLCTT